MKSIEFIVKLKFYIGATKILYGTHISRLKSVTDYIHACPHITTTLSLYTIVENVGICELLFPKIPRIVKLFKLFSFLHCPSKFTCWYHEAFLINCKLSSY